MSNLTNKYVNNRSMNGLISIYADEIETDSINANNIDGIKELNSTSLLTINGTTGVNINTLNDFNINALNTILYGKLITTGDTEFDGITNIINQLFLRYELNANIYMKIFYNGSGFNFQLETPGAFMRFVVKDPYGNYRNLQFNYQYMFLDMPFTIQADFTIDGYKLKFNDNASIFVLPISGADNGLILYNQRASFYTNLVSTDTGGNPVRTIQTAYNIINSLVDHAFYGNIIVNSISITPTELSYIDGVTSNIQTQINGRAGLASPTFTGTLTCDNLVVNGNADFYSSLNSNSIINIYDEMRYKGTLSKLVCDNDFNIFRISTSNGLIISPKTTASQSNSFVSLNDCLISTQTNNINSLVLTTANTALSYGIKIQSTSSSASSITSQVGTNNIVINQTNINTSGNWTFANSATFSGGISVPNASIGQTLGGVITQLSALSTGTNTLKATTFYDNINFSAGASNNKISQTTVSGDITGNNNVFKYSVMRYNSNSATGSANPVLTLNDTFNTSRSITFLPNASVSAFNSIVTVNDSAIFGAGSLNNTNLCLSVWSNVKNGIRISTTSSTSAKVSIDSGTNNLTVDNSTGVRMTGVQSIGFSGGKTIDSNYGNIYTGTMLGANVVLVNGVDSIISNALALSAGTYTIFWNCIYEVINANTNIYAFGSCYSSSAGAFSDNTAISRGNFCNLIIMGQPFGSNGSTCVSFSSATNIYLRAYCVFGTANNVIVTVANCSLRAIKLC